MIHMEIHYMITIIHIKLKSGQIAGSSNKQLTKHNVMNISCMALRVILLIKISLKKHLNGDNIVKSQHTV